ncbi:SHOCT domain-containing protein [Effusibacillus consociatus]|uniref:SHOCT domain-containing protein n=1 Tax=Effusibacillus consociatus TaxID=1117041 RepID=A0ABV9PXM4_9BACL
MMSMMGWGMVFTMLFWIVIIALIIFGVFSLFANPSEKKEDSALQILKVRLARGEISEEEYDRKSEILRGKVKS